MALDQQLTNDNVVLLSFLFFPFLLEEEMFATVPKVLGARTPSKIPLVVRTAGPTLHTKHLLHSLISSMERSHWATFVKCLLNPFYGLVTNKDTSYAAM